MKEMFLTFARACEIGEKINTIENPNTKKYVQELTTTLFRFGADINCVEAFVDKYIELKIEVSDITLDMMQFYRNFFPSQNYECQAKEDSENLRKYKFIERMKAIVEETDIEKRHHKMDDIMCEILEELGYSEIVKIFVDSEKWYS